MKSIKKCKEQMKLPPSGILVKTSETIAPPEECGGFFVGRKFIDSRRSNANGTYIGYVPGCGGDVWWIQHEDGTVGAYQDTEINDR